MTLIPLPHRTLLKIEGEDRFTFLQGLLTCDVVALQPESLCYGAFLTAQGKFLEDIFILNHQGALYLDSAVESSAFFYQKLNLYKLRAQITLTPLPAAKVFASFDEVAFQDPRHSAMGFRHYLFDGHLPTQTDDLKVYDNRRYQLGIADGARDMEVGRAMILEYGFDELGAIDWDKGCYLGQELIARTRYRGLIRKRLLPFTFEGTKPCKDDVIHSGDLEAGFIIAANDQCGIAMIRLEYFGKELVSGGTVLNPFVPDWMRIEHE